MKNIKKIISIFIVSLMLLSNVAFAAVGNTYYVSAAGNDNGTGTRQNPFPSLEAARKAIDGQDGATIIFLGGKYPITEKVTFTSKDNGAKSSRITYKAEEGAEVIFTGAVPLNKELFTKVEDMETLMKLPEISRSKVLMLDLTKQGLTTVSNNYPVLYANDIQATVARYPNSGYAEVALSKASNTIDTEYENVKNWSEDSLKNATLVGNFDKTYLWGKTAIKSTSGTEITLEKKFRSNKSDTTLTTYYYIRNLIEELDAPGEYIVENNILYYYPISDIKNLNMEIITFKADTMIEFSTAKYINFEGITFEKAISSAINTAGNYKSESITIKNCEFKYLMKEVLNIKGLNHIISDNYAYGCGSNFIVFGGGNTF